VGWSLIWSARDGLPLAVHGSYLVARFLLGVGVECNGVTTGHVASHFVADDGRVVIFGLMDFIVSKGDAIQASWCSRESRAAARRWSITFPEAAARAATERARCPGCRHAHYVSVPPAAARIHRAPLVHADDSRREAGC
jgi:hypothetical protein